MIDSLINEEPVAEAECDRPSPEPEPFDSRFEDQPSPPTVQYAEIPTNEKAIQTDQRIKLVIIFYLSSL